MTSRSEDALMNQVRDQFANWEPAAPAGVQSAVYAQMGRGKFLRWGWSLNVWTLGLLLGGATLLGLGLSPEQQVVADQLSPISKSSTAWEQTYPAVQNDYVQAAVMLAPAPAPASSSVINAPVAMQIERTVWEANPMAPLAAHLLPVQMLQQDLKQCPSSRGMSDLWTQLQDTNGNDIRMVYKVTLDEK